MKRRAFGTLKRRPGRPGVYVEFTWEGREYRRVGGPTRAVAAKNLAAAHALLASGVAVDRVLAEVFGDDHGSRLTLREASAAYLAYAAGRKRPSSFKDDVWRLAALSRAPWAGKLLRAIRPEDFLPWIAARQKSRTVKRLRVRRDDETVREFAAAEDRFETKILKGASGPTINKDLNLVSALYRWAVRAGHVEDNPLRRVERLNEKGRAREVYLTAPEARALIDASSRVLRPVVLTALHTGLRRGELLALKWRSVDLQRGEIAVEPETEKAGRGRVVPLTSALAAELAALKVSRPCPALDGSDRVFALADGSPVTVAIIRSELPGTRDRAAIPLEKRSLVTFHVLRHTAASIMVAEGVPLFDVAKILGHSTLAVTMRYAHFAPKAGRSAVDKLGAALAAPSGAASASGS